MFTSLLLALLAACTATLYGLLALWAAFGRGHWFARAAVVAAAIAIFIPVPAYDLAIVFLAESLSIVLPILLIAGARSAHGRRMNVEVQDGESAGAGHRFSLVDLFLLTLVAAGIACLGAYLPEKHRDFWLDYVLIGAGAGMVCLAAAWAALGRGWSWLRWLVFVLAGPSVGFALRWVTLPSELNEVLFTEYGAYISTSPAWFAPAVIGGSGLLSVILLLLANAAGCLVTSRGKSSPTIADDASAQRSWKHRAAQISGAILLLAVSLPPGWAYFRILFPLPIPPAESPDPNGYSILLELGGEIAEGAVFEIEEPGEDDLRKFSSANPERLQAAHAAIDLPHIVPLTYTPADLPDISNFRALARALEHEGKLAVAEGRSDAAATCYLDVMRLGRITAHGGLAIHGLVGNSIDGVGLHGLWDIRQSLSPESRRRLIGALRRLDADRESIEEMKHREAVWQQHVCGWAGRLFPNPELSFFGSMKVYEKVRRAKTGVLLSDLALRSHLDERGKLPERLEQLVPDYLPELPLDPFSERPLVYRPDGVSWQLYSIGPDRKDDGGTPIPGGANFGDGDLTFGP